MEISKNSFINDQLWKAVPGFPCYEAHPSGLIRNAITGNGVSTSVKETCPQYSNYSVVQCNLRDANGVWRNTTVHRVIASTFIEIPSIDEWNWDVDHIDHNTSNNDVRNLRWLPAKLNRVLRTNVRPAVARRKILDYYREHDIDFDYFDLLSEI